MQPDGRVPDHDEMNAVVPQCVQCFQLGRGKALPGWKLQELSYRGPLDERAEPRSDAERGAGSRE